MPSNKGESMTDVQPGGHRRIDRVLAPDFLEKMPALTMEQLRDKRHDAEQEEVDLSYLRRVLQGRIDILEAERARRGGDGASGTVLEHLTQILTDGRVGPRGFGRHSTMEPSRADQHRRRVEAMLADTDLSDPAILGDDQLVGALEVFNGEERKVSDLRGRVQQVMDLLGAEVARRYREGEADVSDLLAGEPGPDESSSGESS
jgi:hypothetical protein